MIVSIGIFIALAIAVILYQKKKLPEWCMRKNSRNIFLMLLGVNSLAAYLFYVDQQAEFMGEHARLERNNCGEGVRTEKLIAKTGGREIPITIELPERQYNGKELEKAFETAMKELDGIILDKNKTFDEVRKDLHFPSRILDMPITVSWEVDNYEVINVLGELQTEALKEEGTIVQITGKLKYGEEERIYMRSANLFPPKLKGDEKIVAQLAGQVAEKEKEHPEQKQVELPETLEGKPVSWRRPEENRGYVILGLGLVGSILLILLEKETQKEEMKKKKKQMMIDYPEILNKFVLFLGAGMTVKAAWQKISSDYEKGKIMGKERFAYEEMALNYTPVAKVTNLAKTMEELKERGLWFVCADMGGESMYRMNLTGPIGLVIGNEGEGVSRLVKEKCDFVASIPMKGDIDSLNASVAAGVLAYEIVRQRG